MRSFCLFLRFSLSFFPFPFSFFLFTCDINMSHQHHPASGGQPKSITERLAIVNEQAWISLGNLAESMTDSSRALAFYKWALKHNPRSVDALSRIASLYRHQEQFDKVCVSCLSSRKRVLKRERGKHTEGGELLSTDTGDPKEQWTHMGRAGSLSINAGALARSVPCVPASALLFTESEGPQVVVWDWDLV